MLVKLRTAQKNVRDSLFYVPMLFIIGAVVLGEVILAVDASIESIPDQLTATVDSARQVLSVIAGATITFAGIAFSVSLLLISLTSSQYSPRVAHSLFRDPFNKRVMAVSVGTFTYCLVVLRSVRGPLEQSGDPIVPSVSILLAVVLGVASILSIVAFISHSAHSMDISSILQSTTDEAVERVRSIEAGAADGADGDVQAPPGEGFRVSFDDHGWVQQVDQNALLRSLDPGSTMRLDTAPGRYAIPETPLCTIWPSPTDEDRARAAARAAVVVGVSRSMQQDFTYGVRQLADVALKALSPGINDPTTAQDALFHLGTVVREVVVRAPHKRQLVGEDERQLLLSANVTPVDVINLAFDEVRIAAAGAPTVQIYLLEILKLLIMSLDGEAHDDVVAALRRQADLTLEISQLADLPEADLERVRSTHRRSIPRKDTEVPTGLAT